jgi:hypothetical protein
MDSFHHNHLTAAGSERFISRPIDFKGECLLIKQDFESALEFAFQMAFGQVGEHRAYRSGGNHRRKNGEIFSNTLQGKLAEIYFYRLLRDKIEISYPTLSLDPLGTWDDGDFVVNEKLISVKSTKHYGNLLLLERNDWTQDGAYVPSINSESRSYSAFVLVRISPDFDRLMRSRRLLYESNLQKQLLENISGELDWMFDVPGWIGINDLRSIIKSGEYLKQGHMLNGRTKMDADNYYVQTGDLRKIKTLIERLST